jgi:hypothetical protein
MNARERFLEVLDFNPKVHGMNWEFGYWGGALNRWYDEGLPKTFGLPREVAYGEALCGPGLHWPEPSFQEDILRDRDVSAYFGFDEGITLVPYNYWIYPQFKKQVLREDETTVELFDIDGIRKVARKDASSIPHFLQWPVKDENDWEKLKEERLNPDTITRRYSREKLVFQKEARDRTFPLGLLSDPVGFFGSLRFLIGEMNLFFFYYDKPKLLKAIADHLCDLWIRMCEELLSLCSFDCAFFWEDMSGKQGSVIGPETFREFMAPYYRRMIDFLKQRGITNFVVDTDGNVAELIPLFMETGITGMYPFEAQAGNDIVAIRKKYRKLLMFGGIDKNMLARDEQSIDRELGKAARMMEFGGYIPFADHLVPPTVSWKNFTYYRQRLKELVQ